MKKTLLIILSVALGLTAFSFTRDQAIRLAAGGIGSHMMGAPLRIGGFSLSLLRQKVRIKGILLGNPAGFPRGTLVDLSLVSVDLDSVALLKGLVHMPQVTIELKEVDLVKNKEGALNVDALKVLQEKEKAPGAQKSKQGTKPAEMMPFRIDILNLSVERVVLKDYSAAQEPALNVYEINMDKSYKNIHSPQQVVGIVLSEPMKAAGIKGAAIYGISALTGAAFLPVAAGVMLAGKDSIVRDFQVPADKAFDAALSAVQKLGRVTRQNKGAGTIGAKVRSASVAVKVREKEGGCEVTVSARQYSLPKPEIASGIVYEMSKTLK